MCDNLAMLLSIIDNGNVQMYHKIFSIYTIECKVLFTNKLSINNFDHRIIIYSKLILFNLRILWVKIVVLLPNSSSVRDFYPAMKKKSIKNSLPEHSWAIKTLAHLYSHFIS